MTLDAKDVAAIMKALEASSFDSLELEMGGVKLSLRRRGSGAAEVQAAPVRAVAVEPVPGTSAPAPQAAPQRLVEVPPGTVPVPAPLLGVFYRAPKPGEPPYVEAGSRVEPDTIIGIIEVMKLMNTVRAGVKGEVVAIAAVNGELVEYGEALLFVRPD